MHKFYMTFGSLAHKGDAPGILPGIGANYEQKKSKCAPP